MPTPLVIEIVFALGRNPVSYLIALTTSANISSIATIIGNPQNIIIGIQSKIQFIDFTKTLIVPAVVSLLVYIFC